MAATLQFVEIPGYADALRREDEVRRRAWTTAPDPIAGVPVRHLTLRDMLALAELRNGFFCPWRFDTDAEYLAHCTQLVWWLSECKKPTVRDGCVGRAIASAQKTRLIRHCATYPRQLHEDVLRYLRDTFMDAPRGAGSGPSSASPIAAQPAYIADALAAGGYAYPLETVLDLPLVRLWQLLRLVQRRVFGQPVTNPSDQLACDHLAKQGRN